MEKGIKGREIYVRGGAELALGLLMKVGSGRASSINEHPLPQHGPTEINALLRSLKQPAHRFAIFRPQR